MSTIAATERTAAVPARGGSGGVRGSVTPVTPMPSSASRQVGEGRITRVLIERGCASDEHTHRPRGSCPLDHRAPYRDAVADGGRLVAELRPRRGHYDGRSLWDGDWRVSSVGHAMASSDGHVHRRTGWNDGHAFPDRTRHNLANRPGCGRDPHVRCRLRWRGRRTHRQTPSVAKLAAADASPPRPHKDAPAPFLTAPEGA